MALLRNSGPPLPNTHVPMDPAKTQRLRTALAAKSAGKRVTMEMIDAVAAAESATPAEVYASMAFDPNLVFAIELPTLFAVCVGGCQSQGAIANLAKMLELRAERLAAGKPAFDVLVRSCLDMCPHSPVAMSRSKHGQAAHPKLSPDALPEIVSTLCDD
jgi:NADH:ubiquinone oxidoreductase subunit E